MDKRQSLEQVVPGPSHICVPRRTDRRPQVSPHSGPHLEVKRKWVMELMRDKKQNFWMTTGKISVSLDEEHFLGKHQRENHIK